MYACTVKCIKLHVLMLQRAKEHSFTTADTHGGVMLIAIKAAS